MKQRNKLLLFMGGAGAFILLLAAWNFYSTNTLHRPIKVEDISGITLWGFSSRNATQQEVASIVTWFNSANDIRANKDLAGTTEESGIQVELKNGERFSIGRSGEDFEVQRKDEKGILRSYWARQNEIQQLLDDLAKRAEPDRNIQERPTGGGYPNTESITIIRYAYDQNRSYQSRRIEKTISIQVPEDISNFMELFTSKEKASAQFDVYPMDYQVNIVMTDGSQQSYDLALSEDQIFFHSNGTGYFINNPKDVNILRKLLATYRI